MRSEVDKAIHFAKTYVGLVEALLREGCTEEVARHEARLAATVQLQLDDSADATYDPARGPCPTCGRG